MCIVSLYYAGQLLHFINICNDISNHFRVKNLRLKIITKHNNSVFDPPTNRFLMKLFNIKIVKWIRYDIRGIIVVVDRSRVTSEETGGDDLEGQGRYQTTTRTSPEPIALSYEEDEVFYRYSIQHTTRSQLTANPITIKSLLQRQ